MLRFSPLPLRPLREPFDHRDWLFELKYDGFRALAHVQRSAAELVSRNGTPFAQFASLGAELRACLRVRSAVLDGELVCLTEDGRPDFNALLFRRGTPAFVAFDVLALNGRDVRALPLVRRKVLLRRVVPRDARFVLYDHVHGSGRALFALTCDRDLEGIVAKWKRGAYAEPSSWIKVKNPAYTGARDRHELLDRR